MFSPCFWFYCLLDTHGQYLKHDQLMLLEVGNGGRNDDDYDINMVELQNLTQKKMAVKEGVRISFHYIGHQ